MNTETKSLFQQIGGMTAVNAAVDIFYSKVTTDKTVSHFFESIDMETQSGKLKAFLAHVFGASLPYTGKSMKDAHSHMQISEAHFNAVAHHLSSTLKELSVPEDLHDEAMSIAASTKNDIVNC